MAPGKKISPHAHGRPTAARVPLMMLHGTYFCCLPPTDRRRVYTVYNAAGGGDWFIGGRCLRASALISRPRAARDGELHRHASLTDDGSLIHVRTRDAPLRDRIGGTASVGKLRFRLRFCVGRFDNGISGITALN